MIVVHENRAPEAVEMRKVYCDALVEAAQHDPRIVTVDCDLSTSCGTRGFAEVYPQRAFNVGIAEQHGCAMAGGLASTGLKPFFHSFAVFSSRRIYDQIFMSCAYAGQSVVIVGCDPGVTAENNGGTHMAFEDVGLLRMLPGITILEPTDSVMLRALLPQVIGNDGLFYLRLTRKKAMGIYKEDSTFTVGKAAVLCGGSDVTLVASGLLVSEALLAAEALAQEGIRARVVDMFSVKPLDEACILQCAAETGALVTAENASVLGGLGGAVAELLSERLPTPLERVGISDQFGQVGPVDYLKTHFGLTAAVIAEKAKRAISRKRT